MTDTTVSLSEATIAAYVRGELSPEEYAAVEAALDRQPHWLSVVALVARGTHDARIASASQTADGETVERIERSQAARLHPGDRLGRYQVQRPLGHGGMGVVYAARDPELGRSVALKLLRGGEADNQERLLREARALAKLSDPRVITIHDVGTIDGRVFLAMELLDGQTLAQWRQAAARSWQEVVKVFVEAGRGLAAAHEAELVHRDFKPSNVMITEAGRVVVLDFGLASAMNVDDRATTQGPGGSLEPASIETGFGMGDAETSLTRTGQRLGTPAYMAPEQRRGEECDARTDQFSFCVALYEALHGVMPKEATAVEGRAQQPAAVGRRPRALAHVLAKGLSAEPRSRHASMGALVELLQRTVNPRARRGAIAATAAIVGAGLAWAVVESDSSTARPCEGSAQTMAETWNEARAEQVRVALMQPNRPWNARVRDEVDARLSAYAEAWVGEHEAACRAARIDGVDSEAVLELRMMCLDRRRRSLHAVVEVLADADMEVALRAVQTAEALPSLEPCRDIERLRAPVPMPEGEEERREAEALFDSLAQTEALRQAERFDAAVNVAADAVERAVVLQHAPTEADARLALGWAQLDRGDHALAEAELTKGLRAAEIGQHDEAVLLAWSRLSWVVGYRLARFEEGRQMIARADAWSERLGRDPMHELGRLRSAGWIEHDAGDYERALELFDTALTLARDLPPEEPLAAYELGLVLNGRGAVALAAAKLELAAASFAEAADLIEQRLGPEHPDVARVRNNLASLLRAQGHQEQARDMFVDNLELLRTSLDPMHPLVGQTLINLAVIELDLGAVEAGAEYADRALEVLTDAYPPEHPLVARAYTTRGSARLESGQIELAIADMERSLALQIESLGEEHPSVGIVRSNLGIAYHDLGRWEEAVAHHEGAIAILEKALGSDHPNLAVVLVSLGITRREQGEWDDAIVHFERAAEIGDASTRPMALTRIGDLQRRRGDLAVAVTTLTQAIALHEKVEHDPGYVGDAWFSLAQARWAQGPAQRDAARAALDSALAAYTKGGDEESIVDARAWLAERDGTARPKP